MLKSFRIGILIVLVLLIFSLVKQDMNLLMQYSAMSGIIALVIAAVIAGVLGSGDRIRANYTHEESDERKESDQAFPLLFDDLDPKSGHSRYHVSISIILPLTTRWRSYALFLNQPPP